MIVDDITEQLYKPIIIYITITKTAIMKQLAIFIAFFLLSLSSFAQEKTVNGIVVNSNTKEPLSGVIVQGKNTTTTTDSKGSFVIKAMPGETLRFSHVGMTTVSYTVNGTARTISISMEEAVNQLNTVVITGYQAQRKADLTGAITVVNMSDVKTIPAGSPLQALQGRVAGMYITRDGTPGGGKRSILIRGINTLGNNDPLFIVDELPVDGRTMEMLDPNDIESLQVLKDASSASIYGSRASNGVIIITTKKASSAKLKVDVNSSTSFQGYYSHLQMLNTEQRGRVLWQAAINDGTDPNLNTQYKYQWHRDAQGNAVLDKMDITDWLDKSIQGGIRAGNTDWFKEISRPGMLTRNNIALSSKSATHSLLLSVGNLYNKGVVKYTDDNQFTIRVNSSFNNAKGTIRVGENLQLVTNTQTPIGSGQGGTPLDLGVLDLPILPVYAADGSFAGPVGSGFSNRMNALQVAELSKDWKNRSKLLFGNLYAEFKLLNNLTYRSSLGIDYSLNQEIRINPRFKSGFLSLSINNYSNYLGENINWTWFNTLNYALEKGSHRMNVLLGTEANSSNSSYLSAYKENFLVETPGYFQINSGTGLTSVTGNETGYKLLSYFSKLNYAYASKYLASVTLRADGSSRFGANNRFGFFPAFSLGWRISEESFIKNKIPAVSQLLLRYGMGETGNQKIANDASFGLFVPGYGLTAGRRNYGSAYDLNGANSGTLPSGVVATQTANPNLKWESTGETNIGVDYGLFDQKLTGSFDYFFRKTKDILIKPPYLAVLGEGGSTWQNGATMENKGWEFTVGYNNRTGDFTYRVNANVGSFLDKVTYLPANVVRAYPGNVEKTIIGHSLSAQFGYVTDGIFQNQQEVDKAAAQPGKGVGRIRYKDLNNDGVINVLDQDWLGNALPDFEYGFSSYLSYKQFKFSFFLQGVQGSKVYNAFKNQAAFVGAFAGQNNTTMVLQAWTPQNPSATIPAVSNFDANNEVRTSSYQIENASYLKLRNIQLSYSFKEQWLRKLKLSRLEMYISGSDLFTIKSKQFTSPDPENPGSFYPIAKSFTIGLNASF